MSWTDLLVKKRYPPDATFIADVPCPGCGYNLRGARLAGKCPECGIRAEQALVPLRRPGKVASGLRDLGQSYLTLFVLPVALLAPAAGLPLAAAVLIFGAVYRLFAVHRLRFEAVLDSYPTVGPRVHGLWMLAIVEAALLAVAVIAAFAAVQATPSAVVTDALETFRDVAVVLWLLVSLASLLTASGLGMALADWLDWPQIRRELTVQRVLLVAGVVLAPMAGLTVAGIAPGATGPLTGWPVLTAAAVLAFTWSIALLLTLVGLLHLANAAELARDEMEDVIDTGRSEPYYAPPAPEEGPDIELE